MLGVMDVDDADVVRRLLSYEEGTAGGLMTPEVIILGPDATVAEALAQIRDPDWVVSIAAQVFVSPGAVQGADRQAPRCRPHPAAAARAAEHGARPPRRRRPDRRRRQPPTARSPRCSPATTCSPWR